MRKITHQQIRLWLPTPPSTNNLFSNATSERGDKGRVRTPSYKRWASHAAGELMIQKVPHLPGPVILDLFHGRPAGRADCSNFIKAAEDLLVDMGVIDDDRNVQRVSSCWVPNYHGTVVHITPYVESDPPWLGFDANVLGQVQPSPLSAFIKAPQTLGKARRNASKQSST